MKLRTLLIIGALLATAWLFWSDPSAAVKTAEHANASVPAGEATITAKFSGTTNAAKIVGALRSREELIGEPGGHTDAIFKMHSWNPPPVVIIKAPAPPKPVAPPMPFTYLGKKFENGVWEAYLARGNETYVIREKTVIEGIYRVEAVRPPLLTLTYLPLKQMQTLSIGEAQ